MQYASGDYVKILREHQIIPSMSRPANPYDNASCESFLKTLKREEIYANDYRDFDHLAGNVEEFHREIRRAEARVVRHHALHGDFSRWIADVLRDDVLAETVRKAERALRHRASAYEIESLRTEVLAAIQDRYQG